MKKLLIKELDVGLLVYNDVETCCLKQVSSGAFCFGCFLWERIPTNSKRGKWCEKVCKSKNIFIRVERNLYLKYEEHLE